MRELVIQAVFIDRDGTIGGTDEIVYPGSFELFPTVDESITLLKELGIKIFSFTNQPGISRGEAREEDFIKELLDFGFDDVFLCSHQHTDGCNCRKPSPGMLIQAAKKHDLDLTKCIVIGDRWTDIVAANHAECIKILVLTGAGHDALNKYRNKWMNINADFIASDFNDAIKWIINYESKIEEGRAIR